MDVESFHYLRSAGASIKHGAVFGCKKHDFSVQFPDHAALVTCTAHSFAYLPSLFVLNSRLSAYLYQILFLYIYFYFILYAYSYLFVYLFIHLV
jgi:hypothetical protein